MRFLPKMLYGFGIRRITFIYRLSTGSDGFFGVRKRVQAQRRAALHAFYELSVARSELYFSSLPTALQMSERRLCLLLAEATTLLYVSSGKLLCPSPVNHKQYDTYHDKDTRYGD